MILVPILAFFEVTMLRTYPNEYQPGCGMGCKSKNFTDHDCRRVKSVGSNMGISIFVKEI